MHLETERLQEKQLNNGTNLLDVSRTLLRIVARLPKTEYSEDKSNGPIRRQAAEDQLDDLPDPASDGLTHRRAETHCTTCALLLRRTLAEAGRFLVMSSERRKIMVRTLKRPDTASIDPYKSQPLPLGKPVSVYYRQSSEGQIGNISTTLQTVDMVEHLIARAGSVNRST
jgi:hypothetical protein